MNIILVHSSLLGLVNCSQGFIFFCELLIDSRSRLKMYKAVGEELVLRRNESEFVHKWRYSAQLLVVLWVTNHYKPHFKSISDESHVLNWRRQWFCIEFIKILQHSEAHALLLWLHNHQWCQDAANPRMVQAMTGWLWVPPCPLTMSPQPPPPLLTLDNFNIDTEVTICNNIHC